MSEQPNPCPVVHPDIHPAALDELDTSTYRELPETQPPGESQAGPEVKSGEEFGGAIALIRRGLAVTPELKSGMWATIGVALATSMGRISLPVLIQITLDRGLSGRRGYRSDVVAQYGLATVALICCLYLLSRYNLIRLTRTSEATLYGLRTRTFDHIHNLSMSALTETSRGTFVARITSDIETLAMFAQWGALAWIIDSAVIVMTFVVMFFYSWQLTLVVLLCISPLIPLLRWLNGRQLRAYDAVRNDVASTLTEISEAVTGAAVVRSYGLEAKARDRMHEAMERQYRSRLAASVIFAVTFTLADIFGAVAIAAVVAVGVTFGPEWGVSSGEMIGFLFLVNLLLMPIAELTEVLDQTQTALSGWRKVLSVADIPQEIVEPDLPLSLAPGPLGVELEGVDFAYGNNSPVLRSISVSIPAGTKLAVVGETGSGKSTLARLLSRLADPTHGVVRIGGVDLTRVSRTARHQSIRMVPQDGFLFNDTLLANVALGREGSTRAEVEQAFTTLELDGWLNGLPDGLDTMVGERGSNISVGERQLVALARAQLSSPGLLILDEATSAVDAETEQALARALDVVSRGRTVISIAHRLSTAEAADMIVVIDRGRISETGRHSELVEAGGSYASMFNSWTSSTRTQTPN